MSQSNDPDNWPFDEGDADADDDVRGEPEDPILSAQEAFKDIPTRAEKNSSNQQKPPGYISREAIFAILDKEEKSGKRYVDISPKEIQAHIKELYGFDENINTISAYKSQYKKNAPVSSISYQLGNPDHIYRLISCGYELENIFKDTLTKWNLDIKTLKSIANATLDKLS